MPNSIPPLHNKPEDPKVNYYQETCKLYIANVVLTTQVNHFVINVFANIHGFSLKN